MKTETSHTYKIIFKDNDKKFGEILHQRKDNIEITTRQHSLRRTMKVTCDCKKISNYDYKDYELPIIIKCECGEKFIFNTIVL